ncbi:MAG: hypothetical protein U9N39_02570 [Campylobacterota bacterium]|nr:hypothetical protein [Campylobacterota bacterium]
MPVTNAKVVSLLDYVKIDSFSVICHFKCKETNKSVISSVPFEPYEGKIEFTWQDILLHPIKSYKRYYHTPITIYSNDIHETIVLKAFLNVSNNFKWSSEKNSYIFV